MKHHRLLNKGTKTITRRQADARRMKGRGCRTRHGIAPRRGPGRTRHGARG